MGKPLHERPILFRRLRILQLITVLLVAILEIIQVIAFIGKFKDTEPLAYYLSPRTFDLCGIKLLYHIVIAFTLLSTVYYFMRFSRRWYHGPYQTDIYVDLLLFYFWIVSGITNVFPLIRGKDWECIDGAFGTNIDFLLRVECSGYIFSTVFGWIMIIEFFISTMLYLRLWKTRNWWEKHTAVGDEESEKDINSNNEDEISSTGSAEISPIEQHRLKLNLGPRFQVNP